MLEKYYNSLKENSSEVKVDLHMHSTASDGTWTPEELVRNVTDSGIRIFALTDHDSIANVAETAMLAERAGLFFIPGVEISSSWNNHTYHILGLGIDIENQGIMDLVNWNHELVDKKDDQAIDHLEKIYPQVSAKEYQAYRNNPQRGGWKALNYLIDKGLCTSYKDFFSLLQENEEFVILKFKQPAEVVRAIIQAGGCAILAHPGASFYDPDYKCILKHMLHEGIQGVECYHPENSDEIRSYALEFSRRNHLLITGGSDCHGTFLPKRRLGVPDVRLANLVL